MNERDARLARTRRELGSLAWILDESIRVPIIGVRFGLEPIIGLIPGVGDLVSGAVGIYIVGRSLQHRLPGIVVARMVANTLLDLTIGAIPVLGDLFDFVYKSNSRNMALFERHATDPYASTREHWIFFGAFIVVAAVVVLLFGWFFAGLLADLDAWLRGEPIPGP